jgi:mono/diheme cytochrome c family protein
MVATNQALLPAELIDHAAARVTPPAPAATAAYGEHLATTAGCRACHRSDLSGGAGPAPGGANLTPGGDMKGWTDRDFMRAIRTGTRPDGTTLASSMPRDFGDMTDLELQAIWLYLQGVPPKRTALQH